MKNNQLMIYGAYGYAGELMVREAVAQGLRPIIAGRDDEKLKPIATELSLECRAFGVRNTGSNLQDISVLLNCAGPFSATAEPLARACLAQQIHYLDITGEIDIFRKCHALDEEARQQNVLILPGAGTDIVPTDCLAAMLKEKLPVATRIDLALSFGTNPSIGTVNTMIESFGKGGLIREGGMLKVVSNAFQMRKIPFQNKPQWAMTIPWGGCFHLRNIYRSSRWRSLYGYAENEHLYDTIDQPGQRDSEYPVRAEDHEASSWLADEKRA